MSAWSKSTKPVVTGISASDIFMVDENEVAATPGITQPGWVYKKSHGGSRYTYETIVAMADAATDTEYEAAGGLDDDSTFVDYVITIDTQPTAQSVTSPADATFTVAASLTGTGGTATYQWQVSTDAGSTWANTVDASGTAATLTVVSTDAEYVDANEFRCVVSVTGGDDVTSNAVALTVA